jgi:hypothetical protein
MYSLLLPLDPNVQRHSAGASVPPGGTWRQAVRDCCSAILHAITLHRR